MRSKRCVDSQGNSPKSGNISCASFYSRRKGCASALRTSNSAANAWHFLGAVQAVASGCDEKYYSVYRLPICRGQSGQSTVPGRDLSTIYISPDAVLPMRGSATDRERGQISKISKNSGCNTRFDKALKTETELKKKQVQARRYYLR